MTIRDCKPIDLVLKEKSQCPNCISREGDVYDCYYAQGRYFSQLCSMKDFGRCPYYNSFINNLDDYRNQWGTHLVDEVLRQVGTR